MTEDEERAQFKTDVAATVLLLLAAAALITLLHYELVPK